MLFAVATPMLMIAPIIDSTLKVVCVRKHPHDACERTRERGDDDEWIGPRLEIDHHQEVDERGGEDEAEPEFVKRGVHAFDLAAHVDRAAGRKLRVKIVYDLVDLMSRRGRDRRLERWRKCRRPVGR